MDKFVDHEEQKRRKAASRERRSAETERRPRRRSWGSGEDDADDAVAFEKITRRSAVQLPGAGGRAEPIDPSLPRSTVAAVHRGRIELADGRVARLAGRLAADSTLQIVVGDEVAHSDHDGVARIEGVDPRRSSLARSDPGNPNRELTIAANIDVAVVVAAAVDPPLRPGLIDRYLLGLERGGVDAVVCVNKVDKITDTAQRAELEQLLLPYDGLGMMIVWASPACGAGIEELRAVIRGTTSVFVGHSGVGKSSLLNRIDPDGDRNIGRVRGYDGRGRHTTTSSSLRSLPGGTRVIDTPGVRSFGLEHLDLADVRAGFPELQEFASGCRFASCTHAHEPDCAVRAAVEDGRLPRARYDSYVRVLGEV